MGWEQIYRYDDWGYTENMWSIDTELAVQLGLISKESPDCYSLNKELRPELRPTQKKTLTAIYEAFGCDEFSSDMKTSMKTATVTGLLSLPRKSPSVLNPRHKTKGGGWETERKTL